jgi:hypothetical protein
MSKFFNKSVFIVSLFFINLILCQDAQMKLDDFTVYALGKSGKIIINRLIRRDNTTENNSVTFDFSSLKELDINGTEVGKSGPNKHSFNNFATLDFKISETSKVIYQNLGALTFDLTASNIQDTSTLFSGRLFIFNQTGTINNNGETSNVEPGTVKLSINIQNWNFCKQNATCPGFNCCTKGNVTEVGSFLEFVMVVKGKESAKQKSGNNRIYSIGGSDLILFQNIQVDGNWTKMPSEYPKYFNNSNSEEYTFRFPTFDKKLSYDPLIQYEKPVNSSNVFIFVVIALVLIGIIIAVILIRRNSRTRNSENLIAEK